jgi:hypothetical protein
MSKKPAATADKPRWPANCDTCTFLGPMAEYDLWHCPQGGLPTVIARYGPAGSYKTESAVFMIKGRDPELREARKRALDRKLQCDLVAP